MRRPTAPPPAGEAGTDALTIDAPSGDAGTDAPTTDAPSGDAGTDAPTTGEDGPSLETTGTILLQAFGGGSGEVAAQVPLLEPGVGQVQTCVAPVNADACQLLYCQLGGVGDPTPGYDDFGPLSATIGTTTVPITYNGFGYGTVYFPPSITLATGGTMTFRGGGGGGVPMFDVSATIPGLPVLTSPVAGATDGGGPIIDTSRDLTVTWLPISIGQIHFGLSGGDASDNPGGTAVTITCTFDGSSGSGVVSQSLLSSLKGASGTSPTYAVLTSELDATMVVEGLTIETQSFQESPTTGRTFGVTLE